MCLRGHILTLRVKRMSLRVKSIPVLQGEEAMRFLDKLFILNVTCWSQMCLNGHGLSLSVELSSFKDISDSPKGVNHET